MDSETVDFLSGQIHALQAFLQAMCLTHPNPAVLYRDAQANLQVGLAKIESQAVSDRVVLGFQWMSAEMLSAVPRESPGSD